MIVSNAVRYPTYVPATVAEALEQKAGVANLLPIAGGTEVMVMFNEGLLAPCPVQSLHRLAPEWGGIREAEGSLVIGALATYTDVRHHPVVRERYPLLVEAARVTGALQIQNRGTLVGNIVNGSPAADTVPALFAYGAQVRLLSTRGERTVAVTDFYTGYRKTVLRADELISEIVIPPPADGARHYYRKVGTRAAQAISKVVVAGVRGRDSVRLAWGSVGPTTLRTPKTEAAIASGADADEAVATLATEMSPLDDIRSTRDYRLAVSQNLLREFLKRTSPGG